jgi:cytochrome c biogenesis protein CcmG, thiol:disulfide interchange protein DsbE
MISKFTPDCPSKDSRHVLRDASSFRAGTIIETATAPTRVVSVAVIPRIDYYSCVRRIPRLFRYIIPWLLLTSLFACYSGSRPARIGSAAPDFTVQDSQNKITLSQFRGQVVVLNFWATWCAPCVEEIPSLVEMQRRMKAKGVTVLAVSVDVDEDAYHQFVKDHNVTLLTVRDPSGNSNHLYGTFKFPETYVIDRNGVMRRKFIGAVDWTEPDITEFLGKL